MPIDINAIIAETRGRNFELFEEHVNPVFVKVQRMLGFNRTWVRGEGPYLWDEHGTRYLDFLTNWGVFNFGRRHPAIRNALQQVLDSDFPGWVGFDAPPLAAVLAWIWFTSAIREPKPSRRRSSLLAHILAGLLRFILRKPFMA
jgi:ornithine--oxo-acid transaminase